MRAIGQAETFLVDDFPIFNNHQRQARRRIGIVPSQIVQVGLQLGQVADSLRWLQLRTASTTMMMPIIRRIFFILVFITFLLIYSRLMVSKFGFDLVGGKGEQHRTER